MPRSFTDVCSAQAAVKKPSVVISPQLQEQLDFVLKTALTVTGEMGTLQLYDSSDCSLKIVCHHGFEPPFLNFFSSTCQGHAACGMALLRRERVIVEDVATDPIFAETEARNVMLAAGARAVQSTPLLNSLGDPLGMLSTHYRQPSRPSARDLRCLDRLARHAAKLIVCGLLSAPQYVESPNESPENGDEGDSVAYYVFSRIGGFVSFVEEISGQERAFQRLRALSLAECGEFVLFHNLNVIAVACGGILEMRRPALVIS